ncbi:unnamed protein product [Symbiodinium pilosum]|uniref:Right handed beta helix domain-containing protein n=1 Tax=Symbiodinium pilosum TaxID=2952 RepID=A0A812WFS5_SYMPI|nr:unnamed protein product [Symbiodinium pilosum]
MTPAKRAKSKAHKSGSERPAKAARVASSDSQLVASNAPEAAPREPSTSVSMERRPFAKLLLDAINADEPLTLERSDPIIDAVRVPINSPIVVEAKPGSPLPPILELPGIVISSAQVTLRHICLHSRATDIDHPLIEVRTGGRIELTDCRLEGAGIKLHTGASARLVRTRISGSLQAGISAADTLEVSLAECDISNCDGEGLHVTSGQQLSVSDCTFSNNLKNGALIDGKAGQSGFSGCTFSANGQFGVWIDSGSCVSWKRNLITGNTLGDIGGRGSLDGQTNAFDAGDSCMVWVEKVAEWLPGKVLEVLEDEFVVVAEVPLKMDIAEAGVMRRTRQKAPEPKREVRSLEIKVPPDAVRLPKSSEEAPPAWSKKTSTYRRRKSAFLHFLREGGKGVAAWKALDGKERVRFQTKARKENKDKPLNPPDKLSVQGASITPSGPHTEGRVQRPARKSASVLFPRTKHRN